MEFKKTDGRIEDYAVTDQEDVIGGHHEKTFVRIDDNTSRFDRKVQSGKSQSEKKFVDSEFFADLYRALSKNGCHYVTYLNDLVATKSPKDRYIPKFVSCLRKENGNEGD